MHFTVFFIFFIISIKMEMFHCPPAELVRNQSAFLFFFLKLVECTMLFRDTSQDVMKRRHRITPI